MDQYGEMGISSIKKDVEDIFRPIISNAYPFAFVNILPEPKLPGYVRSMKIDGDGSKNVYRWVYYLEYGDSSILQGTADDAIAMALGDLCAAGIFEDLEIVDGLHCNPLNINKNLFMAEVGKRFASLKELYKEYGIPFEIFGGETADLPIQENCTSFDVIVRGHNLAKDIIKGEVMPTDHIWGLASDGKAIWERKSNSGIMSNGLHLGAKLTLDPCYRKYSHLTHPTKPYNGKFRFHDDLPGVGMMAADALLSDTRQFPLIFRMIIDRLIIKDALELLHGITLNSGGGATKILRLGEKIRFVKEMPPLPPYFKFLQSEGNVSFRELYKDFNCGVGSDIIGSEEGGILEDVLRDVSKNTGVKLYDNLGKCEKADVENEVVLIIPGHGTETYKKSDQS